MKLNEQLMRQALQALDQKLNQPVKLIMGGGGAMLLAHHFRLSTNDIDALPVGGLTIEDLTPFIREVSKELSLPVDWINPFYASFTHVLPSDYGTRLIEVARFSHLSVFALSKVDLLIMKCFAAREKDVVHARALFKQGADASFVRSHINKLDQKRIPGCRRALEFLDEIETFFEEAKK